MKKELVTILEEILKDFAKTNEAKKVQSNLHLCGILTVDECDKINDCILPDDQFLAIFDLLRSKEDKIFKTLQQICIKLKWQDLYTLIRNKLEDVERTDLVISYAEQLELHGTFTYGFQPPVSYFVGREEYLKNIHDFFQQSDLFRSANQTTAFVQSSNRILLVSGLGGVGKTQLAITYMNKHKLDFDSIVWFNAESEAALISSIYGLASVLDIVNEENLSIKSLSYKIFQKLLTFGTKHLAIFDNADEFNIDEIVSDLSYKVCILITSRHQSWQNSKLINLDVFTEEEAKSFILQTLNIAESTNDHKALKLAQTLDYFPLALQQATAYIKKNKSHLKNYTIEDYLTEYKASEKNAKKLLSFQLRTHNQDQNIATIFATWKITLNKIKDFTYKEMFHRCQTEEDVKESLLVKTFNAVKMIFQKMKDFIYTEKESLAIKECHYSPENVQSAALTNLAIVHSDLDLGQPQTDNTLQNNALVTNEHHYCTDNFQLTVTSSNLAITHSEDLGDPQTGSTLQKSALVTNEHHCGADNLQLTVINSNSAIADSDLGDQTDSTLQKSALVTNEHHYGADNFHLAVTLSNLASTHSDLGNPQTAKTLLERALAIQERHYGPNHFLLAVTLSNLSVAHRQLGDPQTAKTLLERALAIQERHYGPDHFKVATTLSNLSGAHKELGDLQTAKAFLERALVIQERL